MCKTFSIEEQIEFIDEQIPLLEYVAMVFAEGSEIRRDADRDVALVKAIRQTLQFHIVAAGDLLNELKRDAEDI